jgi:hypothetical protein
MTTRDEYIALTTAAYERFTALQQRIARIEVRALARFYNNRGIASYQLRTASEYWLYRDLCSDRDIQMSVAMLNASMAVMTEEDHPKGLT